VSRIARFARSSSVILIDLSLFSGDILVLPAVRLLWRLRSNFGGRRLGAAVGRRLKISKTGHAQTSVRVDMRARRRLEDRLVIEIHEEDDLPGKENPCCDHSDGKQQEVGSDSEDPPH